MAAAVKATVELKPKKTCQHLSVTRVHVGNNINRIECDDCPYIFFMDHALYDRLKDKLHPKVA